MSVRMRAGVLGAAAVAVAIMLIGLRFTIDPFTGATSAGFGFSAVSLGETKGVRDIASGLVLLALLCVGQRRALGAALLAFAVIPMCDAAIVVLNGGPLALALGIHAVTAILLLALAGLVLWQSAIRRAATVGV